MIQFTEAEQDGAICRYNWLHDTEKYGARFDHSGTADGVNGIDGVDGIPGADGANGIDGQDGADGTNGTNGTKLNRA